MPPRQDAIDGLNRIKQAILDHLEGNRLGATNTEIANALDLCCLTHRSGITGNIWEKAGSIEKAKEFSGLRRLKRRSGAERFDRANPESLRITVTAGWSAAIPHEVLRNR